MTTFTINGVVVRTSRATTQATIIRIAEQIASEHPGQEVQVVYRSPRPPAVNSLSLTQRRTPDQ